VPDPIVLCKRARPPLHFHEGGVTAEEIAVAARKRLVDLARAARHDGQRWEEFAKAHSGEIERLQKDDPSDDLPRFLKLTLERTVP